MLQVQQAEGFSKRRLFEMLSPLEEQSRIIMQGARKRLAADKGEAAGQPWNENFMLSGDSAPGATAGRTEPAVLAAQACSGRGCKAATCTFCSSSTLKARGFGAALNCSCLVGVFAAAACVAGAEKDQPARAALDPTLYGVRWCRHVSTSS